MPDFDRIHPVVPRGTPEKGFGRRRFLASLGLLAGAGILGPLLRSFPSRSRGAIEAGRPALGTWTRISVREADGARARRGIERAFAAIRLVDAQMSIHRADSQVSRASARAGRGPVAADPAVTHVVAMAVDAAARSGGIYDPTILPLMRLYGFYDSGRNRFPSDREIAAALEITGWRHLRVDAGEGTLGLDRAGMAIDLGSIGKGWALDRAVEGLRTEKIDCALVDVGGNVYGLGAPEESPEGWSVGVLHPVTGRLERTFHLRDSAVATSGNTEQTRALGGIRVGHLFDARGGRPANGHLSVSVQARTGVESDYLSTVAFLLGPDRFHGFSEVLATHFVA